MAVVVKDVGRVKNRSSLAGLACPGELMSRPRSPPSRRIVLRMQLADFKVKLREHPASPKKKPPLIMFTDEQAASTEQMPFDSSSL